MRIVYVRSTSIYDDSRATKEIKALLDDGNIVDVLFWDRYANANEKNLSIFKNYKNVFWHSFDIEIPNGIGMKNVDKLFKWFKWIKKELNSIINIDFVHACDLDSGIPCYKYCKKNNIKLVYDIYDYYVDSHSVPKILALFIEKKEIKIINYAYTTIICNEERREQIKKARPKRVVVIHNSPDVQYIENGDIHYDYVYCGSLAPMRLIEEILTKYDEYNYLKFYFAGYGKFLPNVKEKSYKYRNFVSNDSIPYSKVLEIESQSLALAAIYEPTIRNHRLCAPNKFYEALALSKPVIVCEGTGIDKIVKEKKCGIVINYNSADFYNAILFLKKNPEKAREYGLNGKKLYDEIYSWHIMEKKLLDIYK